ncbi:MAG: DUF177 domain-containing protein [Rhodospirillales bacterium]|nr:DUF177 domain-containing protein [Rhodospirillales bacterium]
MSEKFEFSRPFPIEQLCAGQETRKIGANRSECTAVAKRLGLPAIDRLEAEISVKGIPTKDLVVVEGRVDALVTQICVVTLQPFQQCLSESFVERYRLGAVQDDTEPNALDLESPDPFPEEGLDLGEETVQQFSLALNPYPRAPGAELLLAETGGGAAGPFASLATLRQARHAPYCEE